MKRYCQRLLVWCVVAIISVLMAGAASAQDSVNIARDLYAAAAYEDALVVLDRLRAGDRAEDDSRTIEQYRAFCLLALERVQEAEQAIEGIIAAQPLYFPSPSDVSPRVRSRFAEVRRRVLPGIVQQKYGRAKAAYDRKDFVTAEAAFKQVLDLLADPDLGAAADQPPLADLRTVTVGFHDLSAAAAAPPPPPPLPPPPPPPPPPVVAPAPVVPKIYGAADTKVVPPVAINNQPLPQYLRDGFPGTRGVLEVVVNERGDVESAVMRVSVKSTYDSLAVTAAKSWHYRAATLDGVPVKFRKLIQITLDPNR